MKPDSQKFDTQNLSGVRCIENRVGVNLDTLDDALCYKLYSQLSQFESNYKNISDID